MPRASLYLRVSTDKQTCENQRPEVEQLVRARGCDVVEVYEEQMSAAKKRPAFERMMRDAHAGRFDVLVVWALDRFGRSMAGCINDVLELDRRGVKVISVREPWLDTSGPVRPLLVAIFGWVAEQERARLIERTKAGIARARNQGIKLGRPTKRLDLREARALLAEGKSLREAAKVLRTTHTTLGRALARCENPIPPEGVQAAGLA